jgi:6-phosphofructokinase 1
MKNIAVFTSGGDAPGMNACTRAVVRTAIFNKLNVFAIHRGYEGMIDGNFEKMELGSVGNIIQRGGTILGTARSKRFMTQEGRALAYKQLKKYNIDGVVAIGGNGTYTGAYVFEKEYPDIAFVGCPGTIDNDIYGTDFTIGYDTALNTVIESVDKIRDTADSHNRLFFIEVMGRDAGFIAMGAGISCGAEAILIPETETYVDKLIDILERGVRRKKTSGIIIVAEGDDGGGAVQVAAEVKKQFSHLETKVTVLGHIQRGGSPTCMDRVLASKLGYSAVNSLVAGVKGAAIGEMNWKIVHTPFEKAVSYTRNIDQNMITMADILAI